MLSENILNELDRASEFVGLLELSPNYDECVAKIYISAAKKIRKLCEESDGARDLGLARSAQ